MALNSNVVGTPTPVKPVVVPKAATATPPPTLPAGWKSADPSTMGKYPTTPVPLTAQQDATFGGWRSDAATQYKQSLAQQTYGVSADQRDYSQGMSNILQNYHDAYLSGSGALGDEGLSRQPAYEGVLQNQLYNQRLQQQAQVANTQADRDQVLAAIVEKAKQNVNSVDAQIGRETSTAGANLAQIIRGL